MVSNLSTTIDSSKFEESGFINTSIKSQKDIKYIYSPYITLFSILLPIFLISGSAIIKPVSLKNMIEENIVTSVRKNNNIELTYIDKYSFITAEGLDEEDFSHTDIFDID